MECPEGWKVVGDLSGVNQDDVVALSSAFVVLVVEMKSSLCRVAIALFEEFTMTRGLTMSTNMKRRNLSEQFLSA